MLPAFEVLGLQFLRGAGVVDAFARVTWEGGQKMDIKRNGSQPSGKGPADWFTGTVRIDPLFEATEPARVAGASVTFEPGARTAWHTHPLGQTLIVTAGCGWAQRWGGPDRGNPARRRGLVSAGRKALARGDADDGDDAHRHPGEARRQSRRLDGKGQRRAIPQVIRRLIRKESKGVNNASRYRQALAWKNRSSKRLDSPRKSSRS